MVFRDHGNGARVALGPDHVYGSGGAVAGAVAAVLLVGRGEAELQVYPGPAYAYRELFVSLYGLYRIRRADIRAGRAFGPAVSVLVAHLRLQEMREVGRGPQHIVGAVAHAELARSAMVVEMPDAPCPGRHYEPSSLRGLLVGHVRESAVQALDNLRGGVQPGACERSGPQDRGSGGEEIAPPGIGGGVFRRSAGGFSVSGGLFRKRRPESREAVAYGAFGAIVDAVEAEHAAAAVHVMPLRVDARGLAPAAAALAGRAFAFIYGQAEQREAAEDAEQAADRADGVAVCPSARPCQDHQQHEGDSCGDEQRRCEAFALGKSGDAPDHSSVGAVGRKQGQKELGRGECGDDGEQQHGEAHDSVFLRVRETLEPVLRFRQRRALCLEFPELAGLAPVHGLAETAPEPDDQVLEDSQGADYGAVEPAEQQREQQYAQQYGDVEGQE